MAAIPLRSFPVSDGHRILHGLLVFEYQQMYRDYLELGILEKSLLLRIGVANDVGFLAQLSLADFHQGQRGRFGFSGLRLVDTQKAVELSH